MLRTLCLQPVVSLSQVFSYRILRRSVLLCAVRSIAFGRAGGRCAKDLANIKKNGVKNNGGGGSGGSTSTNYGGTMPGYLYRDWALVSSGVPFASLSSGMHCALLSHGNVSVRNVRRQAKPAWRWLVLCERGWTFDH